MTNRTFSEVALCHLPDHEIDRISTLIQQGVTVAYKNAAGFFVYRHAAFNICPVLMSILAKTSTDYVLFDPDVEPSPELEIYDA